MKRSPLRRSRLRSKPTREPAELTYSRQIVKNRSNGLCEFVTEGFECREPATGVHHLKLRRHGDHSPSNLRALCAHHHNHVHANPSWSYANGWMIRGNGE